MKVIKLIVNWGILILSPVWILPFLIYMILVDGCEPDKEVYFEGERWFWE